MVITVASGKGGTGKTTVATNLAVAVESDVQVLDCDVEEPNAHLFLKPKISDTTPVTTPVPEIDLEKCTLCGECEKICQFKAIVVLDDTVLTFPEMCHGCGGCTAVCPAAAIKEIGRELGVIGTGHRKDVAFGHGRLRIGEAMAPPMIKKVRALALPDRFTIIDAPPGTSCPVIASMKGTDFVLLVTEPTPFGLYDLKLAVGAVKLLGIPHGLVINRADLGDRQVYAYAEEENIPILMKIPFDRRVAEAYSDGELIVETQLEWKDAFRQLYFSIKKLIEEQKEATPCTS
ncbi:MAG: ATP-binding protein [Desulfobacterales bacterium]